MSENGLGFDQRITWTFIREGTGLVSEKDMDLYERRSWTCIGGPELVSEDIDLYQRTWTCIREGCGLVSEKDLDLHQRRTWTCVRGHGLVSEKDMDLYQRT
jgi:hypothetical protein